MAFDPTYLVASPLARKVGTAATNALRPYAGQLQRGLFGQPSNTERLPLYNEQQQSGLMQQLQQGLQNFNPEALENRARKQFNEQTIPSIAERFSAFGNNRNSSGFQGALGQASSDLESQLAQLRANIGQQQLSYGFQPQFENIYHPETGGLLGGAGGGLGSIAGGALASGNLPLAAGAGGVAALAPLLNAFLQWLQTNQGAQ